MSEINNPFKAKQLKEYGEDGLAYCEASQTIRKYIVRMETKSANSARTYKGKLYRFAYFVYLKYNKIPFDTFIEEIKSVKHDPYDVLAEFASYLKKSGTKPNEIRAKVHRAYKFLRFSQIKVNSEDYRDSVPLPNQEFPDIEGLEKRQVIEVLNACEGLPRLKTAILMCAAMGCRAQEACAVRNCDVDFEKETITFRKEYTKTKVERIRPMTKELMKQIQTWNTFKYRTHEVVKPDGRRIKVTPDLLPDELVLGTWESNHLSKPEGIYDGVFHEFRALAERLGIRKKNGRRIITLHRLRAFAKTTISDLGYQDYSEWFIGHAGSTYYRKTERERLELFRKIEPYLTFLDVSGMEKRTKDMESRLERAEVELRSAKSNQEELERALYNISKLKDFKWTKEEYRQIFPDIFKSEEK